VADDGYLDDWAAEVLADPIAKQRRAASDFPTQRGIVDARVFLPNTPGFQGWRLGQEAYEVYESSGVDYADGVAAYRREIEYDRDVYERFVLEEPILDVGGGVGTVREFLPPGVRYLSVDPYVSAGTYSIPLEGSADYQGAIETDEQGPTRRHPGAARLAHEVGRGSQKRNGTCPHFVKAPSKTRITTPV